KCSEDCILAPYFPASDPQRYACVQRIFGASNVARMLLNLPVHERGKAADTMAMEAHRRVQDPVYGCAGIVGRLQGEITAVQCELARIQAQIAVHAAASATQLNAPAPAAMPQQQEQGDGQLMQYPFQGLDALLVDVNLVDDEMNTD
ncbi:LOB domain-containing protein 12, partial [Dichanthelium oligosanthes]